MYELVDFLVGKLIDKEHYDILVSEEGKKVDIRVVVDEDNIQKVIGKGGRTAKAIRTLVRSIAQNTDTIYSVYIEAK